MSDDNLNSQENSVPDNLQEEYMKSIHPINEGQMIEGKVIEITSETVFIDVGYKSEGKIAITEFQKQPKIGDTIKVVVIRKEGEEGSIIVSKRKADEKAFWQTLKTNYENHEPIAGTIKKCIKGGYDVDLGYEIHGFMPYSKADVFKVDDVNSLVGKKSFFKIERLFEDGKINIVLSRRSWLEEENKRKQDDFFKNVSIGDVIEGTVKTFTSFGAFIDIGGFDGLLHINDISWGHVNNPKEVLKLGDKVKVKVIKMDPEERRINLSLKHLTNDPWTDFETRYKVGDVLKGKVQKLATFGAFIEIEEGIEGLAHISELSWVKRIHHPKEVLKVGDIVDVKILDFNLENKKVSLGVKQVYDDPWSDIESRFPVGMRITRKVKNLSSFGAFFEIEEGIDGLLHIDDFSWTKAHKHPSELLKAGDEIEVMIIDIDKENKKIKLGLKQLSEDPWDSLIKAFPKDSIIEGEITKIGDIGIWVKVQGNIEGLITQANIFDPKTQTYEEVIAQYKVGDKIKAVVVEIKPSRQKLTLSLKDYIRKLQKEEIAKYIHDEDSGDKATIADFIKTSNE